MREFDVLSHVVSVQSLAVNNHNQFCNPLQAGQRPTFIQDPALQPDPPASALKGYLKGTALDSWLFVKRPLERHFRPKGFEKYGKC